MYIHEAVAVALAERKCIRRACGDLWQVSKVQPTNGRDCCYIFNCKQKKIPRWNPKAEDLMADDWIIIEEG